MCVHGPCCQSALLQLQIGMTRKIQPLITSLRSMTGSHNSSSSITCNIVPPSHHIWTNCAQLDPKFKGKLTPPYTLHHPKPSSKNVLLLSSTVKQLFQYTNFQILLDMNFSCNIGYNNEIVISQATYVNTHFPWVPPHKDDFNVATGMNYGAASFSSLSESICNTETGITIIRGAPSTIASFWRWTPWTCIYKLPNTYLPQGQAPRFPHDWLKISNLPKYPYFDWVHHKWEGAPETSARKVTHPNTISTLGGLTLELQWDPS